jgi:hypothetical protein
MSPNPKPKMLILRGNPAPASTYPDEYGNKIAWPKGALHVHAAEAYARMRGYEPVVLDVPGKPQSQHSPQTIAAVKMFLDDTAVTAFYGFSGGGYNVKHILDVLASKDPSSLQRITLVVVIGSPYSKFPHQAGKALYTAAHYGRDLHWEVVYRINPKEGHMFGPDVLLKGWPEGH